MPEIQLEIGPDTGDLPIPALAPGQAWSSAVLRVRAEPTVVLTPPLEGPADPGSPAPWISAAWTAMRPLTAVAITWASPPPPGCFVALKVAAGGVWFTPVPPGRVHPKSYQPVFSFAADRTPRFPPVLASALLLELRAPDPLRTDSGEPDEVQGAVQRIDITVQNPVTDLSVAVGNAPPITQQRGRLDATLTLDLSAALRAAPPGSTLRLRAAAAASVWVDWAPQAVLRPSAGPSEPDFRSVSFGETVRWTQPLAHERIVAATGRLVQAIAPQRCLREPADAPDLSLAQAVFPGQDTAQSLGELGEQPGAVDLWIAACGDCSGTLQLFGERDERPAPKLLAEQPWTLTTGEARWLSVAVPPRSRGPLWLVCQAHRGDALVPRAALPGSTPFALQRRLGGAWDLLDDAGSRPHLHLRVRAPAPAAPTLPVHIRRGEQVVLLHSDGDLRLGPAHLAALNQASGPLSVELTAPGTGTVTLSAWDVQLAPG